MSKATELHKTHKNLSLRLYSFCLSVKNVLFKSDVLDGMTVNKKDKIGKRGGG